MGKLFIRQQGTIIERGTTDTTWIVGNGTPERVYLKASQPGFEPYLVFDPDTSKWYAIGTDADDRSFAAGTLPAITDAGALSSSVTADPNTLLLRDGSGGGAVLNLATGSVYSPSATSIDLIEGKAYDQFGNVRLAWNLAGALWASDGALSVDWDNRSLHDTSGNLTVTWRNLQLVNGNGTALDWGTYTLYNHFARASIDWDNHILYDRASPAVASVNYDARQLHDAAGSVVADWQNHSLAVGGIATVDWSGGSLIDTSGNNLSVNWNARQLVGTNGTSTALDWANMTLANESGATALSWSSLGQAGATGARPTGVATGYMFFDTTLGKPIWFNGTGWVDASGTAA